MSGVQVHGPCLRCGEEFASRRYDVDVGGKMGPKRCAVCKARKWWQKPGRSGPRRKKKGAK